MNFSDTIQLTHTTVFFGDCHGNYASLRNLFSAVRDRLTNEEWKEANYIFLGDYVDRGADPRSLVSALVLRSSDEHDPKFGHYYFISGNHDIAFRGALLLLNQPDEWNMSAVSPDGDEARNLVYPEKLVKFYQRIQPQIQLSRQGTIISGEFKAAESPYLYQPKTDDEARRITVQARRWGGVPSVYESMPTFQSYGCEPGDVQKLREVVPDSVKKWFAQQPYVLTGTLPDSGTRVVICHAGLLRDVDINAQVAFLSDPTAAARSWSIQQIRGRNNVMYAPSWRSARPEAEEFLRRLSRDLRPEVTTTRVIDVGEGVPAVSEYDEYVSGIGPYHTVSSEPDSASADPEPEEPCPEVPVSCSFGANPNFVQANCYWELGDSLPGLLTVSGHHARLKVGFHPGTRQICRLIIDSSGGLAGMALSAAILRVHRDGSGEYDVEIVAARGGDADN